MSALSTYSSYPDCTVCDFVPEPAMIIAENNDWIANLRDKDQTLLGTTIIQAKRHIPELDSQTALEETSFIRIRNITLAAIRAAFEPQTFNVSCLKNHAFQSADTPPEAGHVHWHIKPRYNRVISFAGIDFTDPMPGEYLAEFTRNRPTNATALDIAATIRSKI